jgi:DNA helicase INO80
MTRMIDILEDFMTWKKMSYFKMDGSTTIQDRRFMVEEY